MVSLGWAIGAGRQWIAYVIMIFSQDRTHFQYIDFINGFFKTKNKLANRKNLSMVLSRPNRLANRVF
jgi:hypothetical protein